VYYTTQAVIDEDSDTRKWKILGGVLGSALVLAIIAVIAFFVYKKFSDDDGGRTTRHDKNDNRDNDIKRQR